MAAIAAKESIMANFQIPLNGSNFISEERQRKFQEALDDDHKIECLDGDQIKVRDQEAVPHGDAPAGLDPSHPTGKIEPGQRLEALPGEVSGIDQALDLSFDHQSRVMDLHQQYLAQQAEYMQLITAVLNQQGKVLDQGSGSDQAEIIKTFQRTLDHFHDIREQDLQLHQEFLTRQAEFSDRFLSALEGEVQDQPRTVSAPSSARVISTTEWVVKEPHIILDEQADPGPQQAAAAREIADTAAAVPVKSPAPATGISLDTLSAALLEIVAEKTGYPPEMLELGMDLEADLGIDSIKRVEILGALEERFPALPAADTEVLAQTRTLQEIVDHMKGEASSPVPDLQPETGAENAEAAPQPTAPSSAPPSGPAADKVANLETILLEVVAEKTGYPAEMLEPGMDMEADLGIDSIKRVEILGAMEERVPGLPTVEAEVLGGLRTLGQIVAMLDSRPAAGSPAAAGEPEEKKKAERLEGLQITPARLVELPDPDRLEFKIPKGRPLIVSQDGTQLTAEIVQALRSRGWEIVVWNYPANLIAGPSSASQQDNAVVVQAQAGKDAITSALDKVRQEHGKPLGFIHLHPPVPSDDLFAEREESLMEQAFLLAGGIKTDLEGPGEGEREFFLVVTRTGGKLGLGGQGSFQQGSGLTGLVKTLHWEWPGVFCRALDFSPELEPKQLGEMLIQEMQDPDLGVLEVGLDGTSRVTIERDHGGQE
jgi:acyl carrier protein